MLWLHSRLHPSSVYAVIIRSRDKEIGTPPLCILTCNTCYTVENRLSLVNLSIFATALVCGYRERISYYVSKLLSCLFVGLQKDPFWLIWLLWGIFCSVPSISTLRGFDTMVQYLVLGPSISCLQFDGSLSRLALWAITSKQSNVRNGLRKKIWVRFYKNWVGYKSVEFTKRRPATQQESEILIFWKLNTASTITQH